MRHLPVAVMWVDPGLDTGLAVLQGDVNFWADEFRFMQAGTQIETWCSYYGAHLYVGWERFRIHPRTPPQDAADAIEMIGVTRRVATRALCKILTPAEQHTPKPAERRALQQLGWWVTGKNDAQSAACHMLRWILRDVSNPPPHIIAAVQSTGEG